ncbi:MAG: hypothetical protein ACE5EW_02685 [Thermoplasmata archaeon]
MREYLSCCGVEYRTTRDYRLHKSEVHGEHIYDCGECNILYESAEELGEHRIEVHRTKA